jgi:integrase/recombinase XerD
MLTLWRRHTKRCPSDTRESRKCQCPIWIDWTTQGKRIRKPLGLRDWQVAQQRARGIEADGLLTVRAPITIKKATEDFEKDAEKNIRSTTLRQYKNLFRQLNKFCDSKGYVFLNQLGVVEVREFRNGWTLSPRTAGKHLERLKRFLNWCIENEWLTASPAKPLKSPKVGDTDVVPFTEEEVGKILKACDAYEGGNRSRVKVLANLMLASGLRIGDAVTIEKRRIEKTAEGYSVVLRTAKTGTRVSCPIPDDVAKSILALKDDFPFWTRKSDTEHAAANWRNILSKIFKAAKVKGHPHQFRHTFAKRLLIAGVPVGTLSVLLGHGKVAITEKHYSKWILERQAAVDSAVRASWTGTQAAR